MSEADEFLKEEDSEWIRSVFCLIPKAIYSGNQAGLGSQSLLDVGRCPENSTVLGKSKRDKKKDSKRKKLVHDEDSDSGNEVSKRMLLKRKLQEKILEKREERKADDETQIALRADRKRKREERNEAKSKGGKMARLERKSQSSKESKVSNMDSKKNEAEGVERDGQDIIHSESNAELNIDTTLLSGFSGEGKKRKIKRRKLTRGKLQELQLQLEHASKEREFTDKARTPARSQASVGSSAPMTEVDAATKAVLDHEMEKALSRAKGEEVRDDVKKLKKSIRREKRKTEKSREEWAKRVESLEKEKAAKQEQRERNLKERKESKGKKGHGKPVRKARKKIKK